MKKKHEIFRALRLSEQEFLHFVSEYVQIPSEAPKVGAASVYAGQAWLRDKLVEWGWDPNWLEFWEESPGEPNLAIRIPGRSGEPGLMFNGHADVVPVPGEELARWCYHPYSGRIEDGVLWGRGASDMKGGVASFLWAAKLLLELGHEFEHDLILTVNIGEESAKPEIGVNSVLKRGYGAPLVVNAEPTHLKVCRAAMGWFFFEVSVTGKGTHPANRYMCVDPAVPLEERPGVDAIEKMQMVMGSLARLNKEWSFRVFPLAPPYSMNMTPVHISGGDLAAILPAQCSATYAVVFHPGHTSQGVIGEIEQAVEQAAQGDEWLQKHRPSIRVPVLDPIWEPMLTPESHPGVTQLLQAFADVTGQEAQVACFPGPCDANMIAAAGYDTLIFGPGDLSFGCHGVDEFVPIAHLLTAVQVYGQLMLMRC